MKLNKTNISIAVLVIFHAVGIFGIHFFDAGSFLRLTPFNLLLTLIILLVNHRDWKHTWVLVLTFILGYLMEVLGVNTGFPFGNYTYGEILGPKVFNTPIMIGVNWLILLYASNSISSRFGLTSITKALGAAFLMVLLDYAIEPVAITYNFWTWQNVDPPLANYISWFLVAFLLSLPWQLTRIPLNKNISIAVYGVELGFFLTLNFI